MYDGQLSLDAAFLTTATIEALKYVWRNWIAHDPVYEFPPIFYELSLPFFTALWGIVLGLVGWGPAIVFEWQTLLNWLITIILSLALYHVGVQPLKDYSRAYRARNE